MTTKRPAYLLAYLLAHLGQSLPWIALSTIFLSFSSLQAAQVFEAFNSPGLVPLEKNTAKPQASKGKTIIQFWASWCVGCKANMENTVSALSALKNPTATKYITVSLDENPAMAAAYLEKAGDLANILRERTFVDTNQKMAERLGIIAVPAMILVNEDGSIASQRVGHIERSVIPGFIQSGITKPAH